MLNLRHPSFLLRCIFPMLAALMLLQLCGCATVKGWLAEPTVLKSFTVQPVDQQMGRPTELTSFSSDELYGSLSPNGRYLLYSSNQKGSQDIWLMDLTSGLPRRLTDHKATDTMPAFSPDGERIVFISKRDDVKGDVYLLDLDDDTPKRLTDRETAEQSPVFAPDGKHLYFASGAPEQTRIVRYRLSDRFIEPLTETKATHPAISPDGRWLAYIRLGEDKMNRLYLMQLSDRKVKKVSFYSYQAGFPSFSPDSKELYFVRFYYAPPRATLNGDENGVIWRVPVTHAWKKTGVALERGMVQITSGRQTHLFVQAHNSGLLYTTRRNGNLDVWMEPLDGLLPSFDSPRKQLDFALEQENYYDQLFALRGLRSFKSGAELQEAFYLTSEFYRRNDWFRKQRSNLTTLDKMPKPYGNWQGLARVDLAVWDVEQTVGNEISTGIRLKPEQVEKAETQLEKLLVKYNDVPTVSAYATLRLADIQSISGNSLSAIASYRSVLQQFPEQRERGIQARLALGKLLAQLQETDALVAYYLDLLREYRDFDRWRRHAIEIILAELKRSTTQRFAQSETASNPSSMEVLQKQRDLALVDHLRSLIDANPDLPLLGAILQLQIGRIYERLGLRSLALQAMQLVAKRYPKQHKEATLATFALGELSQQIAAELREQGRFNEAGAYYSDALDYYEKISRLYPPNHEYSLRARREFLSLSLSKAGQQRRNGDIEASKAAYTRILKFDNHILPAHRALIDFGVAQGNAEQLRSQYKQLLRTDPADFVGHYALGYLATLRSDLLLSDLDDAEKHLNKALGLNAVNPYIYLTLGWIAEMRELAFGDIVSGWLETAIGRYQQAYLLNDRKQDLEAEAFILLNLGNGFSRLGNTWNYAYDYYSQRLALNLPFLKPTREALFYLNFGRAAFHVEQYDESTRYFEHALQLVQTLDLPQFKAELVARLALNYQLQGSYKTSTQYFLRSIETLEALGQFNKLAALTRSVALNEYYQGNREAAMQRLQQSLSYLHEYGTPSVGKFSRLALHPGKSLAPFGFNRRHEEEVSRSLQAMIFAELQQFECSAKALREKAELMDSLLASLETPEDEQLRERGIVYAQQGSAAWKAGYGQQAVRFFSQSFQSMERIGASAVSETDPTLVKARQLGLENDLYIETSNTSLLAGFDVVHFSEQITSACAAAEVVAKQLNQNVVVEPGTIIEVTSRLQRLTSRLLLNSQPDSPPPIALPLVWRLSSDLAALSMAYAHSEEIVLAQQQSKDTAILQGLRSIERYTQGISLYKRLIAWTAPTQEEDTIPVAQHTLSPYLLARIHVTALTNLAELAAMLEGPERRAEEDSYSSRYLNQALQICSQQQLKDVCWLGRMLQAKWNGDSEQAFSTLEEYGKDGPVLLGKLYLERADEVRHRLFNTARSFALQEKDWHSLWTLSERENRRMIVDEMAKLGFDVDSLELKSVVSSLQATVAAYRQEVESQSLEDDEKTRAQHEQQLAKLRENVAKHMIELQKKAPRLHRLLVVEPFDILSVQQALRPGQTLVTILPLDTGLTLLALDQQNLRGEQLPLFLPQFNKDLQSWIERPETPPESLQHLAEKILSLVGGSDLVYLDADRLGVDLPFASLLSSMGKTNLRLLRVSSAWGLLESYQNRKLAQNKGIATLSNQYSGDAKQEPAPLVASFNRLNYNNSWQRISGDDLTLQQAMPELQRTQILALMQPAVFEGGSAANLWLLFNTPTPGIGHYSFIHHLDARFNAQLVLFFDLRHSGQARKERLFLETILNAVGVPSFLVATDSTKPDTIVRFFDATLPNWASDSRDQVYWKAMGQFDRTTPDDIQLYGYAGMNEDDTRSYAKNNLAATIRDAVAYQTRGAARTAVETYEQALAIMDYLQDYTFLDKLLQQLVTQCNDIQDWSRLIHYQSRILERAQKAYDADPKQVVPYLNAKKSLADAYTKAKLYDEALLQNQDILDVLLQAKRLSLCGPYYEQRGFILEFARRYEEALTAYRQAYDIYTKSNNRKGILAQSNHMARILRLRLSRYSEAKPYIERALKLSTDSEPSDRLGLQMELANLQRFTGNYASAESIAREVIRECTQLIAKTMEQARGVAANSSLSTEDRRSRLMNLRTTKLRLEKLRRDGYLETVNSLWRQGGYAEALRMQQLGMQLAESERDTANRIMLTNAKGLIFASLGDTDNAIETFNQTLSLTQRIGNFSEQATAYNNLGDTYRRAGKFEAAKRSFLQALEIDRRQNFKTGLSYDYANLGITYEQMQRNDDAIETLNQTLKLSREIREPINELKALLSLGRLYLRLDNRPLAKQVLQTGLEKSQSLNLADWNWRFDYHLGRLAELSGDAKAALTRYQQGLQHTESLPPIPRTNQRTIKLEEQRWDLYDAALDLLARQQRASESFHLAERFRARKFLDLLGSDSTILPQTRASEILHELAQNRLLVKESQETLRHASDEERPVATTQHEQHLQQRDQLLNELAKLNPEYPSYVEVDARPYEELKSFIPEDTAVLVYYHTPAHLLIWTATTEQLSLQAISQPREETTALIRAYRERIDGFHPTDDLDRLLYQLLLQPVQTQWEAKPHLLLVPFEEMHSLPFSAFGMKDQPLLDQRAVQYLSSVNQLRFVKPQEKWEDIREKGLAFGYDSKEDSTPLPFIHQELSAFSYTFPQATTRTGELATETSFKHLAPTASWLHLAAHTTLDPVHPLNSAIQLADGKGEDGKVQIKEVLQLGLKSELTVLSACNTANGDTGSGDEIIGLNRAFLTAGSKQVLASLWRVSDLTTAILMKHFFRQLKHAPPAVALQQAQQIVRKLYPHPAYWAGFRLEGAPTAEEQTGKTEQSANNP